VLLPHGVLSVDEGDIFEKMLASFLLHILDLLAIHVNARLLHKIGAAREAVDVHGVASLVNDLEGWWIRHLLLLQMLMT